MKKLAFICLAGLILAGCQTYGPKQAGGTMIGAGLGGIAGANVGSGTGRLLAVGAGTLLGAALGSDVGRSLDRADQVYLQGPPAQQVPIPPASGYRSQTPSYIPLPRQPQVVGQNCERLQSGGFACQTANGRWNIIK